MAEKAEEKDIRAFDMANGLTYIGEFENPGNGIMPSLKNTIITETLVTTNSEKTLENKYRELYELFGLGQKNSLASKMVLITLSQVVATHFLPGELTKK
ncbi:MAG: hypothetical protein Q8O83_01130 [bacterium]|nr:hypothetical protein [bacterium]